MNKIIRFVSLALAVFTALLLALPARAQEKKTAAGATDEFFIISSIDTAKHQLVFKRPTEVTVLMRVDDRTTYLDEKGKPLRFPDLRAGDTVYVNWASEGEGAPVALRIHKGPMTLAELHKRYLSF